MIIGVAVRFKDALICLPRPNRHSDCFKYARSIGITANSSKADDQGFYLNDGTFLTRSEALEYALEVGTVFRSEPKAYLFSEDLW